MSTPSSRIAPESGISKPAIRRSVVVLPEPEGPSMVKNSPWPISRSTSSTAATSPNCLRSPISATSGGADGVAKRLLHDLEPAVEVLVGCHERHQDAQHVSVQAAREQHQPTLSCVRSGLCGEVRRGCLRVAVMDE